MLLSSRRRRFGNYAQLAPAPTPWKSRWIGFLVILLLVVFGGRALYRYFAPSISGTRVATTLQSTEGDGVRVAISGEDGEQRAELGLRLYDGDRVSTSSQSYATLQFFDGTMVTLDEGSTLRISEVLAGDEESLLSLELERGQLWVETSTGGHIARVIDTPLAQHILPPQTQAILRVAFIAEDGETSFVFETSGPGVEVALRDSGRPAATAIVGEGQQFSITPAAIVDIKEGRLTPYDARSVIADGIFSSAFYLRGKNRADIVLTPEAPEPAIVAGEPLTIDAPKDGDFLPGSTVMVKGRVGTDITVVKVDGYSAVLKEGAFEREIALPDAEEFSIEIQAEDKDGLVVATKELSLSRDIRPPDPPRITSPGGSGSVVSVQEDSFEIVGDATADTMGIVVNGYQLQKFVPGQPWRYLVDPAIGNVRVGENVFEVVALDRGGNRSIPVRITIVWKAEALPTADGPSLFPGSLRVIAPTADGSAFTTTEGEVVIEGETHPDTALISINGFTLTKYLAGKTTWNYVANAEFGTLNAGRNLYTIVARNAEGKILDSVRYTIEKQ